MRSSPERSSASSSRQASLPARSTSRPPAKRSSTGLASWSGTEEEQRPVDDDDPLGRALDGACADLDVRGRGVAAGRVGDSPERPARTAVEASTEIRARRAAEVELGCAYRIARRAGARARRAAWKSAANGPSAPKRRPAQSRHREVPRALLAGLPAGRARSDEDGRQLEDHVRLEHRRSDRRGRLVARKLGGRRRHDHDLEPEHTHAPTPASATISWSAPVSVTIRLRSPAATPRTCRGQGAQRVEALEAGHRPAGYSGASTIAAIAALTFVAVWMSATSSHSFGM